MKIRLLFVASLSTYYGKGSAYVRLVTGAINNEKQKNELAYRCVLRIYVSSALQLLDHGLFGLRRQL
jgi:hypothetical protein